MKNPGVRDTKMCQGKNNLWKNCAKSNIAYEKKNPGLTRPNENLEKEKSSRAMSMPNLQNL